MPHTPYGVTEIASLRDAARQVTRLWQSTWVKKYIVAYIFIIFAAKSKHESPWKEGFQQDIDTDAFQEQVFLHLFEQAEIAKLSPAELHDYRESQKDAWDIYSVVESAEHRGEKKGREEGRAEGLEEGRAKGIAESRVGIAHSMKDNGIDANVIVSCTGLSLDEIQSL